MVYYGIINVSAIFVVIAAWLVWESCFRKAQ